MAENVMSKITKQPAVNACPMSEKPSGTHSFIMGRCFNCGISIRVHKQRVKETNRARWHNRPRHAVKN